METKIKNVPYPLFWEVFVYIFILNELKNLKTSEKGTLSSCDLLIMGLKTHLAEFWNAILWSLILRWVTTRRPIVGVPDVDVPVVDVPVVGAHELDIIVQVALNERILGQSFRHW